MLGQLDVVDVMGASDTTTAARAFRWGPPRQLLLLPKGAGSLFALARDGKRLLAGIPVETNVAPRPLTVVLNWFSGVNQPATAGR